MARQTIYYDMTPLEVYSLVVTGKLKMFPQGYLGKEVIKVIVRNVVLNMYGYTREDVLTKIDHKFFQDNFIGGVRKFFDYGDSEVLIYSFPEWDLKYWEFRKAPAMFWHDSKNQKEFVMWVCEKEGLDATKKEDLRKITATVVEKYGGSRPLADSGGLYELLNTVTDGKYKKWELIKMVSWSKQDVIAATKWLIEEKLNYTPEEVCKIKVEDFIRNNLDGMLQKACGHSILTALELAYPGKYCRTKARGIILKQ